MRSMRIRAPFYPAFYWIVMRLMICRLIFPLKRQLPHLKQSCVLWMICRRRISGYTMKEIFVPPRPGCPVGASRGDSHCRGHRFESGMLHQIHSNPNREMVQIQTADKVAGGLVKCIRQEKIGINVEYIHLSDDFCFTYQPLYAILNRPNDRLTNEVRIR